MALSYTLKDNVSVEPKVTFLRISPNCKRKTLDDIFTKLSDLSWIKKLTPLPLHSSFEVRAKKTLDKITEIINESATLTPADAVVTDAAEYIVSVLAQEAIVNELKYKDVPLPEVYKQQKSQNPGFDFFFINAQDILIFGEAKFQTGQNAYGSALEQIARFIQEKNDLADLPDLYFMVPAQVVAKVSNDEKGYAAAFSSTSIKTNVLINNIKNNNDYPSVKSYKELVLVAVDMS